MEFVRQKREVSATETHLKFGMDGGGGFLKICLSVQSTERDTSSDYKRRKYFDGIFSKRFRHSGVKKIFILALAEGAQENYENVSKLWSALDLNKFVGTIAVDLKLANILCGIMAHSSLYPCTWCFARKDKLSVFTFPKDESLREKWLNIFPRKDEFSTKNSGVCILHFEDKFVKHGVNSVLKKEAIPTIFFYGDDEIDMENESEKYANDIIDDYEDFVNNVLERVITSDDWEIKIIDSGVYIYKTNVNENGHGVFVEFNIIIGNYLRVKVYHENNLLNLPNFHRDIIHSNMSPLLC